MTALVTALARRVRREPSRPLLTWYDLDAGARTELSAATFANWADKIVHLLVELGVEPGDTVALPVAASHPGHWVSCVLAAGAWQAGAVVAPTPRADAVVTAVGPEDLDVAAAGTVLACSLHPLGFGFDVPLPAGVVDFSVDVRSQPDAHVEEPVAESSPAWADDVLYSHADLAATPSVADRVLVPPTTALATLRAAYLAPLLGGGSAVVVTGGDTAAIARVAQQERVANPTP